jgi:hypothetical protein
MGAIASFKDGSEGFGGVVVAKRDLYRAKPILQKSFSERLGE